MKRLRSVRVMALFLALLALPAMAGINVELMSSTKEFSVDGNSFRVKQSGADDFSLIRQVLSRRGIDAPLPDDDKPSHPVLQYAMLESAAGTSADPPPLPSILHAEHFIRLESGSGTVDLAFGKLDLSLSQVLSRLSGLDWKFRETGKAAAPAVIATRNKGRETFIVILEKNTGKFLFVRRMD